MFVLRRGSSLVDILSAAWLDSLGYYYVRDRYQVLLKVCVQDTEVSSPPCQDCRRLPVLRRCVRFGWEHVRAKLRVG